jgi:MFS family permease
MGFTQGLFAALIADTAPVDRRGTAFGMFNLISGLAQFCAGVTAGVFWDTHGPSRTFFVGAALAVLALVVLILAGRQLVGLSPTMANERATNPPDMR